MINRQEVMTFSREFGLVANVIEKDYVLGWLLAGIESHPIISAQLVFKGGTCLKKCYFETYRFSEDLDFTVTDEASLDPAYLTKAFTEISAWVYENSGIEIPAGTISFEAYRNPRGKISVQGKAGYRGPLEPGGDLPRIKFDLTNDEVLVLAPVLREVHHPYSDKPGSGIRVQSYCFEELFAEKIRALAERERPRDLYDVVNLYRHEDLRPDLNTLMDVLEEKCRFKGIPIPTAQMLEAKPERMELEAEWKNMLAHQLPALPPFIEFWKELPGIFAWLKGAVEKLRPEKISIMGQAIDATWSIPTRSQAWSTAVPIEVIRFAAANRLLVNLGYQNTRRLIEPYALRRTKDGNLLLYAVKHNTGESRSYRVDRIQSAEATNQSFTPRYAIELNVTGPVFAPPLIREKTGGFLSQKPVGRSMRRSSPREKISSMGPTYIFQCPVCGKQFSRKSYDSVLNPHKGKGGYPCPGRTGIYKKTKY